MDSSRNWMAIVSLILGIVSICGGAATIVVPIIGLVLGFLGRQSQQATVAIIGLVLNFLALFGGVIFWVLGGFALLGAMMSGGM